MGSWQIWIFTGIALFIVEAFVPGFVLMFVGIGCLMAGLAAYLGAGYDVQAAALLITTVAGYLSIRPLFMKYFYAAPGRIRTNVKALIGKSGFVLERIDPRTRSGRVLIDGEDWKGISIDESVIEVNEKVQVIRVEGSKLLVERLPAREERI
ncbi:MAG: NfeD family protein [Candidatus Manganitrophaceae bacterium]|nr:MAG: NfeD family protein [Candidatus Manganitrophaceae bacterium]